MKLTFRWHLPVFIIPTFIGVLGLYKEQKNSKYFSIKYSYSHAPYVKTTFNKIPVRCLIDTGSNGGIDLNADLIQSLQDCSYEGSTPCTYSNGEIINSKLYRLKNINFLKLNTKNSIICEIPQNHTTASTSYTKTYSPRNSQWQQISDKLICIENDECIVGMAFLKKVNFLIDFNKDKFIIYKKGRLPFFSHPSLAFAKSLKIEKTDDDLIICKFETSIGPKSFLIDTGCTVNKLFSSNEQDAIYHLNLSQGNLRFYNQPLHLAINSANRPVDGILGAEFLYKKTLFLDMETKRIFFLNNL